MACKRCKNAGHVLNKDTMQLETCPSCDGDSALSVKDEVHRSYLKRLFFGNDAVDGQHQSDHEIEPREGRSRSAWTFSITFTKK